MNKLISLLLLGLVACSPTTKVKFKVGECIILAPYGDEESWEHKNNHIEKIIEVGNHSYHTVFWGVGDGGRQPRR